MSNKKLTAAERRRDEDFAGIVAGLEDAIAIKEGRADPSTFRVHAPRRMDVKAIRTAQGLTQTQFAERYGFSASAVRDWEQNRRQPEAAARVLLKVIERRPDAVLEALAG